MSTPRPAAVSLAELPARTAPALIANDAALWVCVRCGVVCCFGRGTIHECKRCGARYVLHDGPTQRSEAARRS